MRRLAIALAMVAVAALLPADWVAAQTPPDDPAALRILSGVEPAEVQIGIPFRSALQVTAPAGASVEYGALMPTDSIEPLGAPRLQRDAGGGEVAVYELVAWATGELRATVQVRVVGADGAARAEAVALRLPRIVSVLPPPGEPVEPRPAKPLFVPAIFGGYAAWWLLALLMAALVAGVVGYRLARGADAASPLPGTPPREWALEQLTALLEAPDRAAPDTAERVSRIVRTYLCRLDDRLSLDLTRAELLDRAAELGHDAASLARAGALLDACDEMRFAGRPVPARTARSLIEAAREWVEAHPEAPDAAGREEIAA